ncbi:glycoside hydrolase family 73 protein [Aerococcaceae bacterium DSM 111176]|nr:glycoside hydrolase family 73 protein [Aerococcaceae bacterium DSM 111176]
MARKKKRYNKTTKNRKKGRPKRSKFKSWWQKFKPAFLQRVGCLTIFLVILGILLSLIVYRLANYSLNQFEEFQQEQAATEQRQEFIHQLVPVAQNLQRQYGVLASVSLGQAALESNFGTSELGASYNNLYGVKTEAEDPDGANMSTMEFVDDEWIEIVDRFKVYPSWEASMREHAELIYYGTSWDSEFYQDVLAGDTYQEQANGLQSAGYATDPDYADKVISMIETWELNQYDQPIEEGSSSSESE